MAIRARPFPEFSWSYSRHRTLCECPRRYYYAYYASHNGWSVDAQPLAKRSYALKRLTTVEMALGAALHRRAAEIAAALRARRRPPSRPQLVQATRAELNTLWCASQHRDGFLSHPSRSPMLFEVYYGDTGGRLPTRQVQFVAERLERCCYQLEHLTLWNELRALTPEDVVLVDTPAAFQLEGLTLYAAPDLVVRMAGEWHVVDWKTGRPVDAASQLAVYALYVEHGLGVPDAADRVTGRQVSLLDGRDVRYPFAREDLEATVAGLWASVRSMRSYLASVERNEPLPMEAFPETSSDARCRRCSFMELCKPSLAAELRDGES